MNGKLYGYVNKNGEIQIKTLPKSFGNISSGFDKLSDKELKKYGWYPIKIKKPVLGKNQRVEDNGWKLEDGYICKKYKIYQDNPEPTLLPYQKIKKTFYVKDENGIYQKQYEIENISLDEYKQKVKQEIKNKLNKKRQEGFKTSLGFKIDILPNNIIDWQGTYNAVQILNIKEITVRDYDNQLHKISIEDYTNMMKEMFVYISELYNKKWAMEADIDKLNTYEDIYNYKIEY